MSNDTREALSRRHRRIGWWSLLVFLLLGIVLEALHGFKVPLYLDVSNEARRHLWTLAHAHGTLVALIHLAFAATLPVDAAERLGKASAALTAASVLLPGGFFLGGVVIYQGDPGLGIALVPLGGAALALAVWWTARAQR